jgi:PAS domain S-box-containing protein
MIPKSEKTDPLKQNTTEIILESISDGVFTVDPEWRIMSFNRAAEKITGISRQEAIGRYCWNVFRSNMCESDCSLKRTMQEGKSFISTSTHIINGEQKLIPITVATSLLKDKTGKIIGGVETFRDHSVVEALRKKLHASYQVGDIISSSAAMKKIFTILPQVAESESVVLIEGETGTGKELLARAIHNLSLRKNLPFFAINCGALPDTLLESELFGYKTGAFTNALKDKPGFFNIAGSGTLLLDEIGDTSAAFQVKLLRVLEEHAFLPLGATKKEKTNARIIASTNIDLAELARIDKFRKDLFYRINVVHLKLPPLRDRMEDIPLLVDHFISKMNQIKGKYVAGIGQEALESIMKHDFPGNIRELENIIEHAFVLCSDGNITLKHLPASISVKNIDHFKPTGINDPVEAAEKQKIISAIRKNNFNRKAAAEELGIHKSTLFRKIKRLGLQLPKIDGRSKSL